MPSEMLCDKFNDRKTEPKVLICMFSDLVQTVIIVIPNLAVIVMMPCKKQEFPEFSIMMNKVHNKLLNFVMPTPMSFILLPETCLNFK